MAMCCKSYGTLNFIYHLSKSQKSLRRCKISGSDLDLWGHLNQRCPLLLRPVRACHLCSLQCSSQCKYLGVYFVSGRPRAYRLFSFTCIPRRVNSSSQAANKICSTLTDGAISSILSACRNTLTHTEK